MDESPPPSLLHSLLKTGQIPFNVASPSSFYSSPAPALILLRARSKWCSYMDSLYYCTTMYRYREEIAQKTVTNTKYCAVVVIFFSVGSCVEQCRIAYIPSSARIHKCFSSCKNAAATISYIKTWAHAFFATFVPLKAGRCSPISLIIIPQLVSKEKDN